MAAKFFTGLPLDGPDPECVLGHGEALLAGASTRRRAIPRAAQDHSKRTRRPARACDESPLAGFDLLERASGACDGQHAEWFETVAEAQRRAKRRLPSSVYGALIAGFRARASRVDDNIAAFAELGLRPAIAAGPSRSATWRRP